jgi:hypothetical protein
VRRNNKQFDNQVGRKGAENVQFQAKLVFWLGHAASGVSPHRAIAMGLVSQDREL